MFFRGVHNQPTQAKEGLWAEACLLGDAADRVQQQLHALSDAHRHLFQQVYTNDMDRFLDRVRSDQGLLGIKVSGRPFISTSTAISPALDYVWERSGQRRQGKAVFTSELFLRRRSLILRWGISMVMMHEQQMDRHDWHHVMAMYANRNTINYRIVAEAEVSHVAHIPESCVAMIIPITMPDFSKKSMPLAYNRLYGYQQAHYQAWKNLYRQASDGKAFNSESLLPI